MRETEKYFAGKFRTTEGRVEYPPPATPEPARPLKRQPSPMAAHLHSVVSVTKPTAIFIRVTLLALLGSAVLCAQGLNQSKYSLVSPGGIKFSDFKGYEDWSVASSARTEEVLKVIVANPAMIKAYKTGTPGNGQPFPEGSRIVKLQWKPKKSAEAPFVVDVPDVFKQVFVMEKDSKRFPKTGGWGYAVFNYDAQSDKFTADPKSLSDCGNVCHTAVKAKDYIFHSYENR